MLKDIKFVTQTVFAAVILIGGVNFLVFLLLSNDSFTALKAMVFQQRNGTLWEENVENVEDKKNRFYNVTVHMWTPYYSMNLKFM
jgi:hypothetical protein